MRRVACAVVLMLAGGAAAHSEDPPALRVDRILEAYGGWPRLRAVNSYRMEGSVMTGHGQAPAATTRLFARPDRLRVVIEHPEGREVRVVGGGRGWRRSPTGTTTPAEGPLLDSMALQAARAALPWILAERREAVTSAAPLTPEDADVSGLQLALGDGLTLRAYVDERTSRITRALTVLQRGMSIAFETRFSDFREVDGVLFPFHEENYAGGRRTATTALTAVHINPEASESALEATEAR